MHDLEPLVAGCRHADAMEQQADRLDPKRDGVDSSAEQNMENQAQAVRESAEAQADRLEDKADATRDAGRHLRQDRFTEHATDLVGEQIVECIVRPGFGPAADEIVMESGWQHRLLNRRMQPAMWGRGHR